MKGDIFFIKEKLGIEHDAKHGDTDLSWFVIIYVVIPIIGMIAHLCSKL